MSVDTRHHLYTKYIPQNVLMRDCIAGDDSIKANALAYVPKLEGQTVPEYNSYVNRAVFENFTSRTLDGITGLIFSKDPQIELGAKLTEYSQNIDLDNSTLTDLAQVCTADVATMGRCGLLVDMPNVNTQGMTVAQVELLNIRPSLKLYTTESIINWKTTTINNATALSMVVLYEVVDQYKNDYESAQIGRYRVLKLKKGIYKQEVYEKNEKSNFIVDSVKKLLGVGFKLVSESYPMMNGKNMTYIPFIPITPDNLTITPAKSPLYDLAKVNLNYFATAVDYAHGAHFTALPTAYIAGHQNAEGETIKLGSTAIHVFQNPQARMEFLEFKGDGLQTLERKMESSKQSMAVLGARILNTDNNAQIAENTLAMKTAGERAIIISIAQTVSRGVKKALEIMAEWSGDNGTVEFKLNTDYNLSTMDAQTLTALVSAWQTGALSEQELFINLQKGELIGESVTFEEHRGSIEISGNGL